MFHIRDLTTYDEFLAVRAIQQQCWGFAAGEGLYPPMLNTAAHNGGTVLGAFDADRMIGFLFGFLGLHHGKRLKLCSQTLGVLPDYRNRGVAEALKWAQRDRMLALGIDLITWTYDPLEAPNARLNLHTLGGIAYEYERNIYGENFGALGQGLPSDRFLVEWWLNSERAERRAAGRGIERQADDSRVANVCGGMGAERHIESVNLALDVPEVQVEIPIDIQAIKQTSLSLALDWRLATRQIFEAYFQRGYCAVDLARVGTGDAQQNFYILKRNCYSGPVDSGDQSQV